MRIPRPPSALALTKYVPSPIEHNGPLWISRIYAVSLAERRPMTTLAESSLPQQPYARFRILRQNQWPILDYCIPNGGSFMWVAPPSMEILLGAGETMTRNDSSPDLAVSITVLNKDYRPIGISTSQGTAPWSVLVPIDTTESIEPTPAEWGVKIIEPGIRSIRIVEEP